MTKTMISARIPEQLGNDLEALAAATRRSKAFLVTEALEDYVKRRAWLAKRIDDAVREADECGEWISHEKMEAWMLSLGSPNELPPPEPDIHKKRP
jgi:RHH-type rel operon transcriptional repressor/antitoxin RelB